MPDFSISIQGLPELLTRVAGMADEVKEEVVAEIIDSVFVISAEQRRRAPVDQGAIRRNIGYRQQRVNDNDVVFQLFANSEHAGYLEFGTKYRVVVPPGLEQIANEMRGPGIRTGLTAKAAIYAWCKRRGIDQKAWYPIFMAIMATGIRAQPFFFKPFFDEGPKLVQRIENILNQSGTI